MTAFHHCCFTWKEPLLIFQLTLGQRLRIKFGFLVYPKSLKACSSCIVLHQSVRITLASVSAVCLNDCPWTDELKSHGENVKTLAFES